MAQPHDNKPEKSLKERRDVTVGILRVDSSKRRRSSATSSYGPVLITPPLEPISPQPSVDRLSVTFAPDSFNLNRQDMEKVHFNQDSKTSADGENGDEDAEEEEEDYSASVSAILLRRASSKRQPSRRRRPSSTFSPDGLEGLPRRRSSNVTTTSAETAISIEEGMTEEHIFQNIKLHKEVLSNVKQQPWPMRRKMKLVKQAKTYVKIHEGELQERLAQSKTTRDMLACCDIIFVKEWQFIKRELANLMNVMVPWELRIKEIESHFGSVVASYFTFLRWLFWVNLVISLILITFVAIPEVLLADKKIAGERKELMDEEKTNATNFMVLWDFEGVLKYSPIFYGYYSSRDSSKHGFGYKGPLAYFLTGLGVYIYSFVATLRRMAENSRQSKLSEKDDECVFTWKLFTGWDYMIGNSETAHNRTASIILGFKEALLEEAEKKRDERSWKMIGLRIFTNLNVLWLLGTSVCAVVFVVQRSTEKREAGGWWRQNEVTIVVSLITNLFPFIFEMLGSLEQYHPRKRLRMQLARIMVLNMLNLYTFILASFSKINDMTIELQGIKQALINASMNQPAELIAPGNHEILIPTVTTISNNILYDILNTTQSSATTISSCYIEKVNCTTKITTEQPSSSTVTSSPLSTSATQSSSSLSTFTALTTLFLLSNITTTILPDSNKNISFFKQDNYSSNNYSDNLPLYDDTNDNSINLRDEELQERLLFHNKLVNANLKRNVDNTNDRNKETKHFILPLNFELFNFGNYSDDYFLTPEDYPDENETDSIVNQEPKVNLNFSTTIHEDNYTESSSTISTTDDGCQYITICPDASSVVTDSSSTPSTSSSIYYTELTETTRLTHSTTTSAVSESAITQDLSIYTKNLDFQTRRKLRSLCWETMFGQELVKLTVMDLVLTILSTLMVDFIRAVFVRVMNNCWCWDLEKKFPQYGDFKIAENILHLVNNQGMVWMGMFFSPGLPLINLIKLAVMMYLRSWAVLTCNVPHEVVFRASRSNNFYLALLLTMLFLCVLPVSYAIVWVEPSWHCGPFSNHDKIYHLFTNSTKRAIPSKVIHRALDYIASPGIVIPLLMLLVLIIYYLVSLTNALREANNDLKIQLRRERTEERRKVFQMVDRKHRGGGSGDLIDSTPFHKWQKTLNVLPNNKVSVDQTSDTIKEDNGHNINGDIKTDAKKLLSKLTKHTIHKHSDEECVPIVDGDGTDLEQADSLPDDRLIPHYNLHKHRFSINQQETTVPADVHKTSDTQQKKQHEATVVHHKHDKQHEKTHDKHDERTKTEKHDTKEKHDKIEKHYDPKAKEIKKHKLTTKYERKDSTVSIRSDSIVPEIRISQTDSTDDSQDAKFDEPSKSSSADTIIATDTAEQLDYDSEGEKRKRKVSYKITKQIVKEDYEEKHKKHHKADKLLQKEELSQTNKKHGILLDTKRYHDKFEMQEDEDVSKIPKKKHEDKHTLKEVHTVKDKHSILDKITKLKPKDHKMKVEDRKTDESIVKKHHHEEILTQKEKKNYPEHAHKEINRRKDISPQHPEYPHEHHTQKHHDSSDDTFKHKKHHGLTDDTVKHKKHHDAGDDTVKLKKHHDAADDTVKHKKHHDATDDAVKHKKHHDATDDTVKHKKHHDATDDTVKLKKHHDAADDTVKHKKHHDTTDDAVKHKKHDAADDAIKHKKHHDAPDDAIKHKKHHDVTDDVGEPKKHLDETHDSIKHKKHHSHGLHGTEKLSKIQLKEIEQKSEDSEADFNKTIKKKKKHIPDETKQQNIQSESSSKEEYSFKLKPKYRNTEDTSYHSSTFSTDDSSKSSKKSKIDKSKHEIKEKQQADDKNIMASVHKHASSSYKKDEKDLMRHKEDVKLHQKDKHKEKVESKNLDVPSTSKLDHIPKDHHDKQSKHKDDEKISDKKEHKREIVTHRKVRDDKEILLQTSSENDDYDRTYKIKHEKSKKVVKDRRLSLDKSLSDEEYIKPESMSSKDINNKNREDESVDDDDDDDEKIYDDDINLVRSDDDSNTNDKMSKKDIQVNKKLLNKSKKVMLQESESKQSSSDTQSSHSQSQSAKSLDDDDNEISESDNSSKEHSNTSVKERSA